MRGAAGGNHQGAQSRTSRRGGAPDRTACRHDRIASGLARREAASGRRQRLVAFSALLFQKVTGFRFDFGVLPMSGFSTARQKMVDGQVRTSDVTDSRILDAMLTVPREAFVPAAQQALAYLDLDLAVGTGGTRRYLLKAALTAKLLQAAEIKSADNVLVVGVASGYAAALVARIAAKVTATESDSALASQAAATFAGLGLPNVTVRTAAAADGDEASAPYDVIILNGARSEERRVGKEWRA